MLQIGKKNKLRIIKQVDFGYYLDGGYLNEILIPTRYVPKGSHIDDILEVFVYYDSEDRLIATTEQPLAEVGKCAFLKVKDTGQFGAFLDWGLMKDLLVPFKEQRVPMQIGKYYMVYLYLDVTGRIAASSRLSSFLKEDNEGTFTENEKVTLQVAVRSDLGYKVVINDTHLGMIHNNEIIQPIRIGETITGYIKNIRPDDKINVTLYPKGKIARDDLQQRILNYLEEQGGSSSITDKSTSEEIFEVFNASKTAYKKALGALYKEKKIVLGENGVRLI